MAATSSGEASPRMIWSAGGLGWSGTYSAYGLRSQPELAVQAPPERVPQPLPGLLVRPQRQAQFLLRLDQEFLVDDRGQDRARQQVADVVGTPGQQPLLGHVLAGLFDADPLRAQPGRGLG